MKKVRNNTIQTIINIFKYSAQLILIFFAVVLALTSLLFLFKVPITIFHLPISGVISAIIFIILNKQTLRNKLLSIVLAIMFILTSIFACSHYYDLSWDGNTYHKDAVALMKNNWNPIYDDYLTYHNKSGSKDMHFREETNEKLMGVWVTHYAKGPWIINANFYKITNDIEASKVFNILMIYASFCITLSIFYKKTKSIIKSLLAGLLFAVAPIAMVQVFTYYNDGSLYSSLTSLLLVAAVFIKDLLDNNKKTSDYRKDLYIWIITLLIICINLKFTCFVYACIFCLGYYLIYIYDRFKNKSLKDIIKPTSILIATILFSVLIVGSSSYVFNTIEKGNPFYPLIGKDKVDIMTYNEPKNLKNKSNLNKFMTSIFSEVGNGHSKKKDNKTDKKIPFSISNEETEILHKIDLRLSGFGVWFSGIFILSIIICILGLIKSYKKDKYIFKITAITLVISTLLILFLSESWWARYTPYVYYFPLIAITYFILIFRNNLMNKIFLGLFSLIIFINLNYYYKYNILANYKISEETRYALKWVKDRNETALIKDNQRNMFGVINNFDDKKIKYEFTEKGHHKFKDRFKFLRIRIKTKEDE